jgi:iron complex outermembrane receptor protein
MTHRTRIVLDQETVRLGYKLDPIETLGRPGNLELRFDAVYFRSAPGNQNRINLGSLQEDRLRRVRTQGTLLSAEMTWTPRENLSVFARADLRVERHVLQHYDSLLRRDVLALDGSVLLPAGLVVPGPVYGDGRVTFTNVGVQGQLEYALNDAWRFTAGTRLDVHSVYGAQLSPRAAIVLAPENAHYHLKAMFGSSFKAPSAAQLYATPVREFDVQGNPSLSQQRARTYELAGGYEIADIGYIAVNGFATQIRGRVEYLQQGLFLSAENTLEEWYAGGELETRIKPVTGLDLQVSVAYARQVRGERREASVVVNAAEVAQPLYPSIQLHAQASYESAVRMHPGGYARFSYVGPRTASDQNAALAGASYQLPAYGVLDLALTAREEFWEGRASRLGVKVENVLDHRYVNPGFGGLDLPALGRSFLLTFAQEL